MQQLALLTRMRMYRILTPKTCIDTLTLQHMHLYLHSKPNLLHAMRLSSYHYAAAQVAAFSCSLRAASCSGVPGAGQRRQAVRLREPLSTSKANWLPCA
jgi:hypothetical protein